MNYHRKYETVGPMCDFVREFHPTADQEYANRRFSEQPTLVSVQHGTACLTFFTAGCADL
jgi:hypothetical protein